MELELIEKEIDSNSVVEEAQRTTIESHDRKEPYGGISPVLWMVRAGQMIPPWWSKSRDIQLRRFVKTSDHLAGAFYNMIAKMKAIPFKVVAKDPAIRDDVKLAEDYTKLLKETAQLGAGWGAFYSRFVDDLLNTDNGTFAEIIGTGRVDGPIIGRPISIRHLDSFRCQRTGNAEFPVIYTNTDGKMYKLHYTRVMFDSQMSSPITEMNGVGFCAASRCINVAQNLVDITLFKQEKLGSRPHRAIVVPTGGLDPTDIQEAFALAESSLDAQGLARYSKVVITGSSTLPEAGLNIYELSSLPDGFNEETSTIMAMATIALALGMDARELFPAMQPGATRADALLQHLKQRGKGPGEIIETTERMFDQKFLPRQLELKFDYQDDAQDRMVAEIKKIRSDSRTQDLEAGSIDSRTSREFMVESGDMSKRQFEMLELQEGRLMDGSNILALFYSKDKHISKYLDLGISDPLDHESNDPEALATAIRERIAEAMSAMINAKSEDDRMDAFKALKALEFLMEYHRVAYDAMHKIDQMDEGEEEGESDSEEQGNSNGNGSRGQKRTVKKPDKRVRRVDLTQPTAERDVSINPYDSFGPHQDDEPM